MDYLGRFVPWQLWQTMIWLIYHHHAQKPVEDMQPGNGIHPPTDEAQLFAGKNPGGKLTIHKKEARPLLFPHWKEILTQLITE